jgi:hypothetical protein
MRSVRDWQEWLDLHGKSANSDGGASSKDHQAGQYFLPLVLNAFALPKARVTLRQALDIVAF